MDAGLDLGIDGLGGFTEVGAGGFAITYSAYESDQDRLVAVKVLHEADTDGRRRFDRERRTMGNTTGHANIVTLFRSGYTSIGNKPYMVMEYLSGGSLQDRLDRSGLMGLDEAIRLVMPIAEALGFSHTAGIVHKDVKPANILVSGAGVVKLTDFGIAALRESTTSQVAYSPSYAPPESFDAYHDANGQLVDVRDGRSDLYSLAASLFALVTGKPPFAGSQLATMRQIAEAPIPPTGIPALDTFLAVAMAKRPRHRYQDADTFIDALRSLQATVATGAVGQPLPGEVAPVAQGIAPTPRPITVAGVDDSGYQPGPSRVSVSGHLARQDLVDGPSSESPSRSAAVLALGLGFAVVAAVGAVLTLINLSGNDPNPTVEVTESAVTDVEVADEDAPLPEPAVSGDGGVVTFAKHSERVRSAMELPDGRIASLGDDGILLWDPADPEATPVSYDGHGQVFQPIDMILLADGRVASADARAVNFWDPASPGQTQASYGDTSTAGGLITTLVELPDGRIASSSSNEIKLWHPLDPDTTLATYRGHETGLVSALTVLPDGRIASAVGGSIHIWSADDPGTTEIIYDGHNNSEEFEAILNAENEPDDPTRVWSVTVTDVVGLPDGRIVSAADDGFRSPIHIWVPQSPEEPLATRGTSESVQALLLLADGRVVAGDDRGDVAIWSVDEPQETAADFSGHPRRIWGIVQLDDGRVVTASEDETVKIWDPSCDGYDPGFGPFEDLVCR